MRPKPDGSDTDLSGQIKLNNWRISQLEDAVREFRAESRKLYWTLVGFMLLNVVLRFLV